MDSVAPQLVQIDIASVFRTLAAYAGAGDDRGVLQKIRVPFDTGIPAGFACRDHGKLGKAVHKIRTLVVEIRPVIVAAHFGNVLKAQLRAVHRFYRCNSRSALS